MGPLLKHLREFPIKPHNLGFLVRIENTHTWKKKSPNARKDLGVLTRAYRSPNLKVEGREKE
jgi:hypothetical protein